MRAAGLAGGRWLAEMRGGGKLHLRLQHWQAKRQENQEEKGERQHSGTWGPHGVGPSLNSLLVAVVTLGPYGHTGFGLERAMWGIKRRKKLISPPSTIVKKNFLTQLQNRI